MFAINQQSLNFKNYSYKINQTLSIRFTSLCPCLFTGPETAYTCSYPPALLDPKHRWVPETGAADKDGCLGWGPSAPSLPQQGYIFINIRNSGLRYLAEAFPKS